MINKLKFDTEFKMKNSTFLLHIFIFSFFGSLLSIAITGFVFGVDGNEFHLPIVGSLYNESQFTDDPFIQSLRHFASGVWLLLEGVDRYVDPYWIFLGGHFLSRFLSFAGFLFCADMLGVRTNKQRTAFTIILALSGLLTTYSYVGRGGIFLNYFNHSEVANGLSLICLGFLCRKNLIWTYASNGIVFFVNAFIGIWNFVPMLLVTSSLYLNKKMNLKKIISHSLIGFGVFTALASPVILKILSNPEFGKEINFDYIAYLIEYFPRHFLIEAAGPREQLAAVLVVVLGMVCFHKIGTSARFFKIALVGYALVYLLGIFLPYFTHNNAILNLHLLRVSTFFHLLAALGSATLAVKWLGDEDKYISYFLAPTLIVLLCFKQSAALSPIFIVIFSSVYLRGSILRFFLSRIASYFAILALIFTLFFLPSIIFINNLHNQNISKEENEFSLIGIWARTHTAQNAIFLITAAPDYDAHIQTQAPLKYSSAIFQYASHRRVWVNWKSGAAVMWSPSFYYTWVKRIRDVQALQSLEDALIYAKKNSINYLIDKCINGKNHVSVYKVETMCVYTPISKN
jgi:hypothetical protein